MKMWTAAMLAISFTLPAIWAWAEISDNLLVNPSFEEGVGDRDLPAGWSLYGGSGVDQHVRLVEPGDTDGTAVLIEDGDPATEIGLTQTVAVEPDLVYQASARVKAVEGASTGGAYLQLRFSPSGEYFQTNLAARSADAFEEVSVKGIAPPDTKTATIYLYTHRDPTPKVIVDSVALVSGVEPPPPPPPEPVPPVYTELKELHLTTDLVQDGKPSVTIIVPASGIYDAQAGAIQQAIEGVTAVQVPIATDESPQAAVPIAGNLICLGNRSTNRTIGALYDLYYTLLDLRYPGSEGHVVRTLHNPFGDGHNVIFVGGSDEAGVRSAAATLIGKVTDAGGRQGALWVERLMEIKLGKGIEVPTELTEFEIWEASRGYGSTGYFGWNSISKRMAMYYMTGDEFQAREALRLAFPDEQAKQEIGEIDGERIENKDEPLSGPYHYNAHMMILFWDLIEESQVFSDEERLRVTNAFSKQLNHRKGEGIYGRTAPPAHVGSRHGQWSAVSLHCLGRYFQKDYPDPIWHHCIEGAKLHFAPLHEHAWVSGENDNLFWYNTAIAPIFTYLVLSGDRVPLENGVLAELLRGQEILANGGGGHFDLNSASIGFLHKAAYLTQDGRWVTYRDRTGVDLSVFRLGQSFWPEDHLQPVPPSDLVGKWSIQHLPQPMWEWRKNGFPIDQSFLFGSFRSTTDQTGDYILLDGFNGASRNPYHTFAILDLRLNGHPLLAGYRNQVLTRADGLVEPKIAMDAALRAHDVVGGGAAPHTVYADAEVPNAAYCNWRRMLVQRPGHYALIIDDLTFRTDAENMEVQTLWEAKSAAWDAEENVLQLQGSAAGGLPPGWTRFRALDGTYTGEPSGEENIRRLPEIGIVLLRATEPGSWLEMELDVPTAVEGEVFAELVNYTDRAVVKVLLDGETVVPEFDHQAPSARTERLSLGERALAAGKHRLRVEVVRRHEGSDKCYVGLSGLLIAAEGAAAPGTVTGHVIAPCDLMKTTASGGVHTMEWTGPVKQGDHRVHFSLIAPRMEEREPPGCIRMSPTAAALALPRHALAVWGPSEGIQAEMAVIAETHLFGRRLTEAGVAGALVRADKPVDIDWDFARATVNVVADEATELGLALASTANVELDGESAELAPGKDGLFRLPIDAGRHVVEGAKPGDGPHQASVARLATMYEEAGSSRQQLVAAAAQQQAPQLPALAEALAAQVGEGVVDLITLRVDDQRLICVAEGQTVHLLGMDGAEVGQLQADGPIRMIRWWPEPQLLLAGCTDEQVIAFTLDGERKWVFTSVMDPAVFRAAKTYWFKSAPGHEGIHGLHTGVFLDGKSQCFVGSACTLEILDENGELIKRMPQFWGKVSHFAIIDGPEGSLNLLASRRYNGTNQVRVINNRTVDPGSRGFHSVPPGHTYVGGWSSMNRHHLFYEDLDGDGTKEVVSEINGTWNRVTVWDAAGTALHDASFGPGNRIPAMNMRDLDIIDLDGDGKQEILAATWLGLVVALNHQCEKLWAKRLASPPVVMKAMEIEDSTPWVVVGCENGDVVVLDGSGELIRQGQVSGRPTCIEGVTDGGGPVVLLTTSEGEVKGFKVRE